MGKVVIYCPDVYISYIFTHRYSQHDQDHIGHTRKNVHWKATYDFLLRIPFLTIKAVGPSVLDTEVSGHSLIAYQVAQELNSHGILFSLGKVAFDILQLNILPNASSFELRISVQKYPSYKSSLQKCTFLFQETHMMAINYFRNLKRCRKSYKVYSLLNVDFVGWKNKSQKWIISISRGRD